MHLPRHSVPVVAAIAFLISISVFTVISIEVGFKAIVARGGWLRTPGMKLKRDDSNTPFLSPPWNLQGHVKNFETMWKNSSYIPSNRAATITACSPIDLSLTTTIPPTSIPAISQNPTIQLNATEDTRKTPLGVLDCKYLLSNLPICSSIPTSARCICQGCSQTVYPAGCQEYIKTKTVTETYLGDVHSRSMTPVSFTIAFTVTITTNLSAGITATATAPATSPTSAPPIMTSKTSLLVSPSLLGPSIWKFSSSAIVCPNGALAKRQLDCVSPLTTLSPILSSISSPSPNPGSLTTSQTILPFSDSGNVGEDSTSVVGSVMTNILSKAIAGQSSTTSTASSARASVQSPPYPYKNLSNTNPVSNKAPTSNTSTSNFTIGVDSITAISLPNGLPVQSTRPTIKGYANSSTGSGLATITPVQGLLSNIVSDASAITGSVLPTIISIPGRTTSVLSNNSSFTGLGLGYRVSFHGTIPTIVDVSNSVTEALGANVTPIREAVDSIGNAKQAATGAFQGELHSDGGILARILSEVISALPKDLGITPSLLGDLTGGDIHEEIASSATINMPLVASIHTPVSGGDQVVTVTHITSVIGFMPNPPSPATV